MGEEAVSARARDKHIDVVETTMFNKQRVTTAPVQAAKRRTAGATRLQVQANQETYTMASEHTDH
jgi:hypothetical protein